MTEFTDTTGGEHAPVRTAERSTPGRLDAGAFRTVSFLSFLYGSIALASGAVRIADLLGDDRVQLTLPMSNNSDAVTGSFGPDATASVESGTLTSATVVVDGIDQSTRALLAAGSAIDTLTQVAVVVAIMTLCITLVRGRPFTRTITTPVTIASGAVAIGSLAGQALTGFGTGSVSAQLGHTSASSGAEQNPYLLGFAFDLTPVIAGLALALVAQAFLYAERMQHDTEGLV